LCEYKSFSKEAIGVITVGNQTPVIINQKKKGQSRRMDRIALELRATRELSLTGHVE
jgi:hypothetical protein